MECLLSESNTLLVLLLMSLSKAGMSNSRPAGLFRPSTSFYVARESIWLSYKKNKINTYATLYHTLWKCVSIPQVSVSICRSVYTQKLTLVCVWYAMVFPLMMTAWTAQRNKAELKCSSTIDGKTRYSPFI